MGKIVIGESARLKQPTIQGKVVDTRYNKDHEEVEHELSYVDASGETQSRWFLSSELEKLDESK